MIGAVKLRICRRIFRDVVKRRRWNLFSAVPSRKLIFVVVVADDEIIYDFCAFRRRDAHDLNDDIRILLSALTKELRSTALHPSGTRTFCVPDALGS